MASPCSSWHKTWLLVTPCSTSHSGTDACCSTQPTSHQVLLPLLLLLKMMMQPTRRAEHLGVLGSDLFCNALGQVYLLSLRHMLSIVTIDLGSPLPCQRYSCVVPYTTGRCTSSLECVTHDDEAFTTFITMLLYRSTGCVCRCGLGLAQVLTGIPDVMGCNRDVAAGCLVCCLLIRAGCQMVERGTHLRCWGLLVF